MRPKLTRRPRNTPPNGPRSTPSSPPCRTKNSPCGHRQDHFFVVIAGQRSVRGCLPRRRRPPHEAQTDSQTTKYSSQWAAEHALITPLPDKKFALRTSAPDLTKVQERRLSGAVREFRSGASNPSFRACVPVEIQEEESEDAVPAPGTKPERRSLGASRRFPSPGTKSPHLAIAMPRSPAHVSPAGECRPAAFRWRTGMLD